LRRVEFYSESVCLYNSNLLDVVVGQLSEKEHQCQSRDHRSGSLRSRYTLFGQIEKLFLTDQLKSGETTGLANPPL
jgi:hypothetical protein